MTPGQRDFANGFAATLAQHGQEYTRAVGGDKVVGVAANPREAESSLPNGQDGNFRILVADAVLSPPLLASQVMPASPLATGHELTKGTKNYRVVSSIYRETTATWLVTLTPEF